jgi:hypothetical protein
MPAGLRVIDERRQLADWLCVVARDTIAVSFLRRADFPPQGGRRFLLVDYQPERSSSELANSTAFTR